MSAFGNVPTPGPSRVTCAELIRALPSLLDGELGDPDRYRAHLDDCGHCLAAYRFERAVLDRFQSRLRAVAPPAGLVDRVRALVAMAGEGGSSDGW